MARDVRVAFKLSEEKKQELESYSNSYGVSTSALCALIVGQWLHQQQKVINPIVEAMSDVIQKQLSQEMNNVDMDKFIEKNFRGQDRP